MDFQCSGASAGAAEQSRDVRMVLTILSRFLQSHHVEGGRERIGLRGLAGKHGCRKNLVGGLSCPRIKNVSVAPALRVEMLGSRAGCRESSILQADFRQAAVGS